MSALAKKTQDGTETGAEKTNTLARRQDGTLADRVEEGAASLAAFAEGLSKE